MLTKLLLQCVTGRPILQTKRLSGDLGRFGLGLKTASFSQCRRLTVASAQQGVLHSTEWDLNLVNEKDDWLISILEEEEIRGLPFIDKLGTNGTLVVWRELDRLLEDATGPKQHEIINEKLDNSWKAPLPCSFTGISQASQEGAGCPFLSMVTSWSLLTRFA